MLSWDATVQFSFGGKTWVLINTAKRSRILLVARSKVHGSVFLHQYIGLSVLNTAL